MGYACKEPDGISGNGGGKNRRLPILQPGAFVPSDGRTPKACKKAYVTSGQRRIANEAERCICRNLQTVYTVEQLALRAGVSPSSLKKYFAMVYGCPISEYIRRKRMEYACALLKDTDQSIADINSESAGYQLNFYVGGAVFSISSAL